MDAEERYTDWKEIGSGAYGSVYKVYDVMLRRQVAIKLLKSAHSSNKALVEALQREVTISRDLRHPNICPIHDVYLGERGVGTVMDLIDGQELGDWLKANQDRRLETASERLTLFIKITKALAFAHTQIVHRDLKPANIFLLQGNTSKPVIMDFGASVVGSTDGMVAGTPRYMSPEQWENPKSVDKRSDLFALGIMAYEFFTNQVPATSLRQILKTKVPPRIPLNEIPPPSNFTAGLPAALDRVILQLMAYNQDDRPQSAEEVLEALSHISIETKGLSGQGVLDADTVEQKTVLLPGGRFILGTRGGTVRDAPRTYVRLSPFRMSIYLVTNEEYGRFLSQTGYAAPARHSDRTFERPNHPVVGVTWDDAKAYAEWVGGSLPSEAQWEHAAKGGKDFPLYPWGDSLPTPSQANIDNISETTSPVDSCPSGRNSYGIFDLCGNVWEWCLDMYNSDYYRTLDRDSLDPVCEYGPGDRVLRGGGFDAFASQGRCSFRYHAPPEEQSVSIGFRVVFPE